MLDLIFDVIVDSLLGAIPNVILRIVLFAIGVGATAVGMKLIGESTQIGSICVFIGLFVMFGTVATYP